MRSEKYDKEGDDRMRENRLGRPSCSSDLNRKLLGGDGIELEGVLPGSSSFFLPATPTHLTVGLARITIDTPFPCVHPLSLLLTDLRLTSVRDSQ